MLKKDKAGVPGGGGEVADGREEGCAEERGSIEGPGRSGCTVVAKGGLVVYCK